MCHFLVVPCASFQFMLFSTQWLPSLNALAGWHVLHLNAADRRRQALPFDMISVLSSNSTEPWKHGPM